MMRTLGEYLYAYSKYRLIKPFHSTTLEEFCDVNNIDVDNINENQLTVFYECKDEEWHTANAKEKYLANIDESLTSYSGKKLAERIEKIIGEHGQVHFFDTNIPHTIVVELYDEHFIDKNSFKDLTLSDTKESKEIQHQLDKFMYYITRIYRKNNVVAIEFEPMYSENMTNAIRSNTDIMYHVTSKSNVNKMLKIGLTPKVGRLPKTGGYRYFPEKIFLISGASKNLHKLIKLIASQKEYGDMYSVIKVDLSGHNIGLYRDDQYNSDDVVYTFEAIPPQILKEIELEDL